jgi:flagellar hook-basal body complex protein FliE
VIVPVGSLNALGSGASIDPIGGLGASSQVAAAGPSAGTSFASELSNALDSVQQAQTTAATSEQGLATGAITDPTQAITAVENAQMAMELASQVSQKATSDVQTIFSTQL